MVSRPVTHPVSGGCLLPRRGWNRRRAGSCCRGRRRCSLRRGRRGWRSGRSFWLGFHRRWGRRFLSSFLLDSGGLGGAAGGFLGRGCRSPTGSGGATRFCLAGGGFFGAALCLGFGSALGCALCLALGHDGATPMFSLGERTAPVPFKMPPGAPHLAAPCPFSGRSCSPLLFAQQQSQYTQRPGQRSPDNLPGGWNCRALSHFSQFYTTRLALCER
jgi:hypothetical protein